MGLNVVGAMSARRFGMDPSPFVFGLIVAPIVGFIQKFEADFFVNSKYSRYDWNESVEANRTYYSGIRC